MVTKTTTQPDLRVDDAGRWLCNAAAGCDNLATAQATRDCSSCDAPRRQLQEMADSKQRELDEKQRREDAIKDAARGREGLCGCGDPSSHDGSPPEKPKKAKTAEDHVYRPGPCPRPQSSDLTAEENAAVRVIFEQKQSLGADLERLTAAAVSVDGSHTHPVFACAKHERQLPK